MRGYYAMPEQTARAIDAQGWRHTRDLGAMHDAGRLVRGTHEGIDPRRRRERRPADVGGVLHRYPAVIQAQVIGVPDPRPMEAPAAYVMLHPGSTTPDDLTGWCRERCAGFRVPRHIHRTESFDRIGMTGSAKVQNTRLREFALRDLGLG